MAKANWSDIEALVKDWFDQGLTPDRGDIMDLAYQKNANDDVIDAIDTLGPRPLASIDALKEQLTTNGVLA